MLKKIFCLLAVILIPTTFVPRSNAASDLSSFSVYATGSVWVRQGAVINSGDIGVQTASPGPWLNSQSEVSIGHHVYIAEGLSIYGDSIKIKTGASVFDVYFNELTNKGTVRGVEHTPLALPMNITLPEFPISAPGTDNYVLARGETLTLVPGVYGEIMVRKKATLILTGGTYYFENLDLGSTGARVLFQAPTDLVINNRLEPGQNATIGPDAGSDIRAKDIRIYVNGINGSTGNLGDIPKAAQIGHNNTLKANIYAPNGTVWIKRGTVAEGAFIGKDVKIGENVQIFLNSGFGIQPTPVVSIFADPENIQTGESATLSWTSNHADSCVIKPGIGAVDVNGSIPVSPAETATYTITATGPGGTATDSITITVDNTPPPPTIEISATPAAIEQGGSSTLTWNSEGAQSAFIDNNVGRVPVNGSTTVYPDHTTTYTITVTGPTGSADKQVSVMVSGDPEPQPEGYFGETYVDLIPPDATVQEYNPRRFSLITGLAYSIDGASVSGVSVTLNGHPEYGTAFTDEQGRFSIPVEGGGTMTLAYHKEGFITAHRKVYVPWNDIAITDTLQMIAQDPASSTITFNGQADAVVTHQSTQVSDEFGSRSCTMVFTGDNHAYLVDEAGNDVHELPTITVRATEFTTPDSMPAKLPPNSAFTYCVELSVDGAQRVRFEKPVITWVNNFLGFDVGMVVPVGYYDRDRGVWVPADNGVVVKLLDTDTDGMVDALDADGDDQPDDLNNNGSFSDEVTGLNDMEKYPPNSTFWRVAVTHFTAWDSNWGFSPPSDAIRPNPEEVPTIDQQVEEQEDCQANTGSFAEERSRIFHEDISISGTDMTLHYSSDRVEGFKTNMYVPASGETIPPSLKSIIVKIEVAGRTFEQILSPLPNQKAKFSWDGKDYLARLFKNVIVSHINIGFVYKGIYQKTSRFGYNGNGMLISGSQTRQEVTLWKKSELIVHPKTEERKGGLIADGWSLSSHHYLDPMDPSILYKGDGTISNNVVLIIDTIAGNGNDGYSGDGGPAVDARLYGAEGITVDAAGNLYIADSWNHCIRKVDTNGIITTVAGNGTAGYSGDGGPAIQAQINHPGGVSVDAAGNLYIADSWNHCIRKVNVNGMISTVAGRGTFGHSGDGAPAVEAELFYPDRIAVDSWGNLYIVDNDHSDAEFCYIRKVDQNGIITTVMETAYDMYYFDIAVDRVGNLFVAEGEKIIKLDTSGIITTVAGNGTRGYSGDGGPATQAQLSFAMGVAVNTNGDLYIADTGNYRIRRVDNIGNITTIAGTGIRGYRDGASASQAQFRKITAVAVDPSGDLYIADSGNDRIRKVAIPYVLAGFITGGEISFAEGSGIGNIMSGAGLHQKTIDLDTGVVLREFNYDENNKIISMIDRFGNPTIIERDGNGVPTSITPPDGLTTTFAIDAHNHLTRITNPDGSYYNFEYTPDGLLTAKVEPEGNRFEHVFDINGRLTDATDEEGGHWQFTRTASANGDILSEVLTGEGNLLSYLDHTYSTGAFSSSITGPTGSETLFAKSADGLKVKKTLTCGMDLEFNYDVDSEYKFKYVKEMIESTPAGLEKITLKNKTYQDKDSDDIPDLITESVTINGKSTTLENDVLQSQKTITSPQGRTVTWQYDPATRVTTRMSVPGLYETAYGYNNKGELTSISTDARISTFIYNAQGFLESATDPENLTTTYHYDAVGRVTGINRPDGTSIGYAYDNNGNMTVLTNPTAVDHGFTYNMINLKSAYQSPLSGSYSYVYDKDRRLVQVNFPSGNQINNIYDTTRISQVQTPEGNIDFTYLCGTKMGSITTGSESITYGYDGKLLTSEALSGTLNQALSYTYNNDFSLTGFSYAGSTTNYSYDNDGLLTGIGSFTIARNAGNGLPEAVTGGDLNLTRIFNGYGEIQGQDLAVHGQTITSWTLGRDNTGRITQKTETVNGITSDDIYTYDPMGRLLTVTRDGVLVEEYDYDANGTRIYEMNSLRGISGRNFSYDEEDHLLTAGTTTYQYNVDGFLAAKTQDTDVTTYDYSSRGELLSVALPNGTIIEYVHDPLGRRIAKTVNGILVEKYLWQGLTHLLAVYDGSDNLIMRFEYADSRMPVAMTSGGNTYYFTYDPVGSLRIVADASGNVIKSIDYDAFGNIINDSNSSFMVPFGFAGGLQDRDTGLVRFGYRDYDPDTGRWTAKDPILFAGGDTDLYGYCLSDPVNLIDPWGLYLTAGQQATVSFVSGLGAIAGGLFAGGMAGSAAGGAVAGAIGTAFMEGSTWQDVTNSFITGVIGGLTGSEIANLLEGTMIHSMEAAFATGAISGMLDALMMGADQIIKEPNSNSAPCK